MSAAVTLAELNRCDRDRFLAICGPLFERSPWVAERTWPRRPFSSRRALHEALVSAAVEAAVEEKLSLIQAHPDLVGRMERQPGIGELSAREQAAAGLDAMTPSEAERLHDYNRAYREAFGFPFIICARENRAQAILRAFPERLGHTRDQEIAAALSEIGRIAWLRLLDAVTEDGE